MAEPIEGPSGQELIADEISQFVRTLSAKGFSREQVLFGMLCANLRGLSEVFGEADAKRFLTWFQNGFDATVPHPGLAGMETKGRA